MWVTQKEQKNPTFLNRKLGCVQTQTHTLSEQNT